MALSNTYTFNPTESEVISAALRKIGVLAEGQSASTNQTTYARLALNTVLKALSNEGMPIWYIKTAYLYPSHNTSTFSLGPSGNHWTEELILTKLTNDEAAASTAIEVSTTEAIDVTGTTANSDVIGIELDNGNMHWTTISAGGGTANLTIASGLPSEASSGNRVYAYTAKGQRPERILDGYIVTSESGARRPIEFKEEKDVRQTNMTTEGALVSANYKPFLTNGLLTIWPKFVNGKDYLELRVEHPFDDMTTTTDNIAVPNSCILAIIYQLAVILAPEYGVPDSVWIMLKKEAQEYTAKALAAHTDLDSFFIYPA
jgi:hypothetical protein